jgi:hypothetical protein
MFKINNNSTEKNLKVHFSNKTIINHIKRNKLKHNTDNLGKPDAFHLIRVSLMIPFYYESNNNQ